MNDTSAFYPPRKAGVIFHVVSILILAICGGIGLFQITSTQFSFLFFIYILFIGSAIFLIPLLIYRLSYLQNSVYILERDSLRLQWGLRVEVIPTRTILWVQRAEDLAEPIHYPLFRWPGSVLGTRKLSGDTPVEFMASGSTKLVLIATYEKVFAISPPDPEKFLEAYQRLTEMGSIGESVHKSEHPTALLSTIWNTPTSRSLIIISVFLSVVLFMWIVLVTPTRQEFSLVFSQGTETTVNITGVRLIIIPLFNTFFLLVNIFFGILLFRKEKYRVLAHILWGNSILVTSLFLFATYVVLRNR